MKGVIKGFLRMALLTALPVYAQTGGYPAPVDRFDDRAIVRPPEQPQPAVEGEVRRLEQFERQTGIRIVVQFHAKSPPEEEDKVPGAYMRALSTKLGLVDHGILVVYFADDPDWRIWFGDQVAPVFVGKPTKSAKELTADGSIHDAKEAFLKECHSAALELEKRSEPKATVAPGNPIEEGMIIADGLVKRLGPKP